MSERKYVRHRTSWGDDNSYSEDLSDYNNEVTTNCLGYMRTCPVCGKEFLPAPFHAYKVKRFRGYTLPPNLKPGNYLCSYSCYLKANPELLRKR